jgi:hypothetical protein
VEGSSLRNVAAVVPNEVIIVLRDAGHGWGPYGSPWPLVCLDGGLSNVSNEAFTVLTTFIVLTAFAC